jgi:dihydrofolate reductase
MSLDGYIAGPNGEIDWIVMDPAIDFGQIFGRFDTALMGRRTFEATLAPGAPRLPLKTYVFSRTLDQSRYSSVTIVSAGAAELVSKLRHSSGKDIWLFGGGELFRSFAEAGLVDSIEVAIMPVILGKGVPFAPELPDQIRLNLTDNHVYPSGIVKLQYDVSVRLDGSGRP